MIIFSTFAGDRELRAAGFIRARDGRLLDNGDGFFDEHPDPIREYDSRTMVAISKGLLFKLLDALEHAGDDHKLAEQVVRKVAA